MKHNMVLIGKIDEKVDSKGSDILSYNSMC